MSAAQRLAACAALGVVCGFSVWPAAAVVPSAARIADAVARENRSAGRDAPLLLEVRLVIGEAEAASGVLATHPTGLARLELRSRHGFVERHLLQGSAYSASRDGLMLDRPHPFLPPVFLIQTGSGASLAAALESFGGAPDTAVLGRVGDHDCYVLGGRLPPAPDGSERRLPSLWVDLDTLEVMRIDVSDGVRYRLGPSETFDGGVRAPRWIAIEAPDQLPIRLEIHSVSPATAPAAAFGVDWLTTPPPAP